MSNDFYLSILIVLIFLLISINGILLTQYELIKQQWPKMKCNPLVMPFAKFFGEDPIQNFSQCIKDIQVGYMDIALRPLNLNIGFLGDIGVNLLDSIVNVRQMLNFLRNSLLSITSSIFSIFSNILVEFQKISLGVKDSVSKMVAVMFVMTHTLNGSVMTMKSAWKGPPGELLRGIGGISEEIRKLDIAGIAGDVGGAVAGAAGQVGRGLSNAGRQAGRGISNAGRQAGRGIRNAFCFHPDTLLRLDNNTYVKMKDVVLGSKLKNGSIVEGILKLNNLDASGSFKEKLYEIPNGENKQSIFVTGKHLIYSGDTLDFVKNHKDARITDLNSNEFSCLITNDHLIPIGNHLFWDWEDTPEMTVHLK